MENFKSYQTPQKPEVANTQTLNNSFERDFDFILKHAENSDPDFLQVLLKCEMENPNRLEKVMCDLLNIPNAMELIKEFRKSSVTPIISKHFTDDLKENCTENKKRKIENGESYLNNILEIFPDADEKFLLKECKNLNNSEDYSRFINTVMISGMYPKQGVNEGEKILDINNTYDISCIEANQTFDSEISLLWEKNNPDLYIIESPKKTKKSIQSNITNDLVEIESVLDLKERKTNVNNEISSDIICDNYTDKLKDENDYVKKIIEETTKLISSDVVPINYTKKSEESRRRATVNWIYNYSKNNSPVAKYDHFTDVNDTMKIYFESCSSKHKILNKKIITTPRRSSAPEKVNSINDFSEEKSLAEIIEESRCSRKSVDLNKTKLNNQTYFNLDEGSPSCSTMQSASFSPIDDFKTSGDFKKIEHFSDFETDLGEEVESKVSEDWLNEQTANLIRIFPHTDPSYLREEAIKMNGSTESMNAFVIEKLEKNDMPTRADFEKKLEMEELQNSYTKNFSIENFLKAIPEPWEYFQKGNRNCEKYKTHSLCYLKSTFRKHYVRDIVDVFRKNNCNLYVSFKDLASKDSRKRGSRRSEYECNIDRPTIIDIQFLQEVAFIENESKIKNHIESAKKAKLLKFEEAKRNGSLLECQCCFDNEILVEDIVYCPKDHAFCKDCVIRSVEIEMGNGKYQFECLSNCEEKFPLTCLQSILSSELFSKVIQAVQIEEIRAAEIEDLVQCPFCNYATIMPPEEKVLICLNPECLKESCRMCKEVNHIPLRCDEVEKSNEVKIRTYIENKMTEALIRTCYKCNKKFVKEDGCNKMTCTCGAKMCYVCRKPVTDYSHFNGQGGTEYHKCPLYSTNDELHVDLVTQIGMEAKAEILEANPQGRLLHDPTLILPKRTHDLKKPGVNNGAALNFGLRAAREALNQNNVKVRKSLIDDDEVQVEEINIVHGHGSNNNGEGNNYYLNQDQYHHNCRRNHHNQLRQHNHHHHHHHHHHY